MHLLPWAPLLGAARAMELGAKKYGTWSWAQSDNEAAMRVYLDATQRHLIAIFEGEMLDTESKLPHVFHLVASALIAAWHTEKVIRQRGISWPE